MVGRQDHFREVWVPLPFSRCRARHAGFPDLPRTPRLTPQNYWTVAGGSIQQLKFEGVLHPVRVSCSVVFHGNASRTSICKHSCVLRRSNSQARAETVNFILDVADSMPAVSAVEGKLLTSTSGGTSPSLASWLGDKHNRLATDHRTK